MKIAVAGTGYVGMSIATLLAQKNHVTAVDGGNGGTGTCFTNNRSQQ